MDKFITKLRLDLAMGAIRTRRSLGSTNGGRGDFFCAAMDSAEDINAVYNSPVWNSLRISI
ncbi:MAG: hypothetical protein CMO74_05360 [Verrucomicrobiales bacterium]|nr:hypothetical protein [Verrucomicrobiales bacterium]